MNSNKVLITSFSEYLKNLKNYSEHTVKSYTRDVIKFFEFPNTKDLNITNIDNGLIKIWSAETGLLISNLRYIF